MKKPNLPWGLTTFFLLSNVIQTGFFCLKINSHSHIEEENLLLKLSWGNFSFLKFLNWRNTFILLPIISQVQKLLIKFNPIFKNAKILKIVPLEPKLWKLFCQLAIWIDFMLYQFLWGIEFMLCQFLWGIDFTTFNSS